MPSAASPTSARMIAPDASQVTPALLPDFAAFCVQLGLPELVATNLPVPLKAVVHTIWAKCLTLVLSVALGRRSMKAIDANLRPLTTVAHHLGLPGFPEQSEMQRFRRALDGYQIEGLRDLASRVRLDMYRDSLRNATSHDRWGSCPESARCSLR